MDLFHRDAEKLVERFSELIREYLGDGAIALAQGDDTDVTSPQIAALRFVDRHEPAYVGHLSAGLSITPPAATKAVDRLVVKGLVDRREDPGDRRQHLLTVTQTGRDLLDRLRVVRQERLSAVLFRMQESERKALLRGLRGFMTAALLSEPDLIASTCERCGIECFEACVINQAHLALYGQVISPV